MFSGMILITVGIFQAFAGLVGILEDEILVLTPDYLVQLDATTWGWIHMILGLIVIAAGFGIFSGNILARTLGVFVALGSMISMFMWLPWYPIWAIIIISMDIAIHLGADRPRSCALQRRLTFSTSLPAINGLGSAILFPCQSPSIIEPWPVMERTVPRTSDSSRSRWPMVGPRVDRTWVNGCRVPRLRW